MWGHVQVEWGRDRVGCCCGCLQVIVAESYGGNDEPVDSLVASLVGVGVEVS